MRTQHSRNTVRYYLFVVLFLAFLFFSNDFGLIDTQKTAIVTAAGIDREGEEFILTTQIVVPQASPQGKSTQAVQLVSRGKTVSEAFEQINAKTGWYPKLVFCKLLLLGEKTTEQDVFDVLDFFLLDEYLTEACLVAACDGLAKDILDTNALVDATSSLAIEKVLSAHAERVGTVHPSTLKDFAIGYFGEDKSGTLPILKKEAPQEEVPPSPENAGESSSKQGQSSDNGADVTSGSTQEKTEEKPVFSAKETALFVRGIRKGRLTAEETFALNAATGKLRLASYSVAVGEETCTLNVKHNDAKIKLSVGKEGDGLLQIDLTLTAGVSDYSKALTLDRLADAGEIPDGVFAAAEKKLTAELSSAYEKARAVGCDVFAVQERLIKYKARQYHMQKENLLDGTALAVKVRFEGIR